MFGYTTPHNHRLHLNMSVCPHVDRGQGCGDLYAAFNAHHFAVDAPLPPPPVGQLWTRVVDTNLPPPKDFTPGGNAGVHDNYMIQPFSSIVLISKPVPESDV